MASRMLAAFLPESCEAGEGAGVVRGCAKHEMRMGQKEWPDDVESTHS
jgi:hypothetical protein